MEISFFLDFGYFLEELLIEAQLFSRHFLSPFRAIGRLAELLLALLLRLLDEVLGVLSHEKLLLLLLLLVVVVLGDGELDLLPI